MEENLRGGMVMSDKMTPIAFQDLLGQYLVEFRYSRTLAGVPFTENKKRIPIGAAAGPHTQLAGNLVAAYAAGAMYMELKTVQVLEQEQLGIQKPCISVGHEVYNTEWSTELTIEEAKNEYIKAYLLIQVLCKELELGEPVFHFICSVGYDLQGIQSQKVDHFLNAMQSAKETEEWKKDIAFLKEAAENFEHLTLWDIEKMEEEDCISDTVTLSTMHGCKAEEIESIVTYLLEKKGFHVYVKMNPTLIGKEKTEWILKEKGYKNITFREEIFLSDLKLSQAEALLSSCQQIARKQGKILGVKMTNTFPVIIQKKELQGDTMYLSGTALYALSVNAAAKLINRLDGMKIPISYSGGADKNNIVKLLKTGMQPITMSSILLQAGGYRNLTKLLKEAECEELQKRETVDKEYLTELAEEAVIDFHYNYKPTKKPERKEPYDVLCAKCHNCVDVCPNRANIWVEGTEKSYVVHMDALCNECGCCASLCVMGHVPYQEKYTIFSEEDGEEEIVNLAKKQGKLPATCGVNRKEEKNGV